MTIGERIKLKRKELGLSQEEVAESLGYKSRTSIFTDEEINKLWDNLDKYKYIDTILIMIYTGMRIGELLNLKKEDIDLIEQTITVTYIIKRRRNTKIKASSDQSKNGKIKPLLFYNYNKYLIFFLKLFRKIKKGRQALNFMCPASFSDSLCLHIS